jgi:hypothetical protein
VVLEGHEGAILHRGWRMEFVFFERCWNWVFILGAEFVFGFCLHERKC